MCYFHCVACLFQHMATTAALPTIAPPPPHLSSILMPSLEVLTLIQHAQVLAHHLLDQVREQHARLPAQLLARLGRVADEQLHLGGAEVLGVDAHQHAFRVRFVEADLVHTLAAPLDGDAHLGEGALHELTHAVRLARGHHKVVRLLLLQHEPHGLHKVLGVAPVALGVKVAQEHALLLAAVDAGHGACDLASHKGGPAARRLVVEQDAVHRVQPVRLALVDHRPEGELLGHAVGRARVEGRRLLLRHLLHLAVQLAGGRLVKLARLLHAARDDGVQHAQRADAVRLGGVLGHLEGHLDVRLGGQVVDLVGADLGDERDEVGGVGHVAIVEAKANIPLVGILVKMLNATSVEGGGAPDQAVHFIALVQQQFG
mmetsp:Transcript_20926/g.67317  ORF Transcript_20926/g.67317 Transcript_20926/m.67317 type:complete len:372 (-) Transcript_20926:86-1201(-)